MISYILSAIIGIILGALLFHVLFSVYSFIRFTHIYKDDIDFDPLFYVRENKIFRKPKIEFDFKYFYYNTFKGDIIHDSRNVRYSMNVDFVIISVIPPKISITYFNKFYFAIVFENNPEYWKYVIWTAYSHSCLKEAAINWRDKKHKFNFKKYLKK